MVHDTRTCGENDVTELTGWEKLDDPLLQITELDVVAGADAPSLVEAVQKLVYVLEYSRVNIPAIQLNDDFAVAVVIDFLELANVT
jgi:hypothetical protein